MKLKRFLVILIVTLLTGLLSNSVFASVETTVVHTDFNTFDNNSAGIVWTSPQIGYFFYTLTSPAHGGLYYVKTNDTGLTWGDGVKVQTQDDDASRIMDFSVWLTSWNSTSSNSNILIAWTDTIDDAVYFRILQTALGDVFLGENTVTSMGAFTYNANHTNGGISVTESQDRTTFYISVRTSTSASTGNKFLQSVDNGVVWTNLQHGVGAGTVATVHGQIFPDPTNATGVWALDIPNADNVPEFWKYDSDSDTWSTTGLVVDTATTSSGIFPGTVAFGKLTTTYDGLILNQHAFLGYRDASGGVSSTFYVYDVTPCTTSGGAKPCQTVSCVVDYCTDITRMADVYTDRVLVLDGVSLEFDSISKKLYATFVQEIDSVLTPTYRVSIDGGATWQGEVYAGGAADLAYPRTAPVMTPFHGAQWMPAFTGYDGVADVETLDTFKIASIGVGVTHPSGGGGPLPEATKSWLTQYGLGDAKGQMLFGLFTLLLLGWTLLRLRVWPPLAGTIMLIWGGGIAVEQFIPAYIILLVVAIGGLAAIAFFLKQGGSPAD